MISTNQFPEGIVHYNDDILHIQYRKGVLLTEEVLSNGARCRRRLTGNQPVFMLLDMSLAADITECALAYAAENPDPGNVMAIAVITRGGRDHIRAKLYTVFDEPNILTKAFLSVSEGKEWLLALGQNQAKRVA
ncbi:MAG: hypothetical protein K0S33_3043 [Bacteroidetes bacterium]|jgi:hypothetical protein|nr:hypothetical protein [Bacteroidota bacterium]